MRTDRLIRFGIFAFFCVHLGSTLFAESNEAQEPTPSPKLQMPLDSPMVLEPYRKLIEEDRIDELAAMLHDPSNNPTSYVAFAVKTLPLEKQAVIWKNFLADQNLWSRIDKYPGAPAFEHLIDELYMAQKIMLNTFSAALNREMFFRNLLTPEERNAVIRIIETEILHEAALPTARESTPPPKTPASVASPTPSYTQTSTIRFSLQFERSSRFWLLLAGAGLVGGIFVLLMWRKS